MTILPGVRLATLFASLFLAFSTLAIDQAEARRGGSFGSPGGATGFDDDDRLGVGYLAGGR